MSNSSKRVSKAEVELNKAEARLLTKKNFEFLCCVACKFAINKILSKF
ncbi:MULTISPECIES: hypothetical protein [unclassified Campylobacter]|nr:MULTISPECIES: hypothetical protein [unclassified Campylobacter]MDA3043272.1 hypothetical protein [Campylobacter sp. JMF_09 ED2]MDA3045039.1 hypothetical protein [Campylobacter sp. JMF_07 ED4]MDA3064361.1 hypothetical protein [Campylobacter sp. JMF_11 EL3]MDA3071822.1 hypothetical protein [Campylobacter sp. VBCF_03 NA9]MDA3075244.1 hypothetical protein [Campylobacter sp. JMF_05 ED3]